MAHDLAPPELADDLDGLLEHLGPDVPFRPALPEDVLVEVLAGPDAEEEPTGHQCRGGRGSVGDDGRMDPDGGAGDARSRRIDRSVACGDRPEHAPHERAVALAVDPRVEVVRDQGEREAGFLGHAGVPDEVAAVGAPRSRARSRARTSWSSQSSQVQSRP